MKKSLKMEVSPSEMLYYREHEGLTNKQIAERLGCSVASVYRFIGKRSYSVTNAQAQNKPLPVPESVVTGRVEAPIKEDEPIRKEEPMVEVQKKRTCGFGCFRILFQFLYPIPDRFETA